MYFIFERVNRITEELKGYIYPDKIEIAKFLYKDQNYQSVAAVNRCQAPWKEFYSGTRWGGRDQHYWFRAVLTIPEQFSGKPVALRVSTHREKGLWNATNPQFLLYIDEKMIQGLDVNHQEAIVAQQATAGTEYQIDLWAYSGMNDWPVDLWIQLVTVDEAVKNLYYNLHVPLMVSQALPENDERKQAILNILNMAVNRLDLRKPFSDFFYTSLAESNQLIEQINGIVANCPESVATCIGHTHIDVAWLWTLAQTREKTVRSFATVLRLMDEYPEYLFMSSQPQLYQFVKEDHPELYAEICARVKEGRWEPEGAMWVEADCNLASGESLVRQILFGTRFFAGEFGVKNQVLWLPDVFGYSAALPQILKKSGIDYFMTTKISWNEFNKMPYDTFMWEGIDGTAILTHFITTRDPDFHLNPHVTTYNGKINPEAIIGGWQRYQQKDLNNDILVSFGYGDGGGGPTAEMLENARRMVRGIPGCPKVQMGKVGEYFKRLEAKISTRKDLPKWVGELYLEFHRGTYTSMARNKRYNRKSELLYQDIELLAVCSLITGREYPQEMINQGWKTILLNQFHDILPGSSIREVYEDSKKQYEEVLGDGQAILARAINDISAKIQLNEPAIVVFNTLSFERDEIVSVNLPGHAVPGHLIDASGKRTPFQIIEEDGARRALFLAEHVPAKGYKTYRADPAATATPNELMVTQFKLDNQFFQIAIDEKGTIASFYDKRKQRQVLKSGMRGNQLLAFEDKPADFDNWEIANYYQEKYWELDNVTEIAVIEQGPVRGGIRICKRFLDSQIVQNIYIYKDLPRVDFDTFIDWRENQILLKAAFPVDVHAVKATYDIQFGNVERPTHRNTSWDVAQFEVCAHKWVDLSESGYGVSLINDCKYGHDIKDGVLRLTLLKSGKYPNPDADRETHHFLYSLYPHNGDWREGRTIAAAYSLNVPLYAKREDPHQGNLPDGLSFFNINQENIIMETVKKAEDSEAIIVRLYEGYNRRTRATLNCFQEIDQAWECDLMENDMKKMRITKNGIRLEMKPYEIKTLKIQFKI